MANKKVTIEIEYADSVQHDLADLTCWWEGFLTGMSIEKGVYKIPVADNGVRRVQNIISQIKNELTKLEKNDF